MELALRKGRQVVRLLLPEAAELRKRRAGRKAGDRYAENSELSVQVRAPSYGLPIRVFRV